MWIIYKEANDYTVKANSHLYIHINPVITLLLRFYIDCIFHTVPARCAVFLL